MVKFVRTKVKVRGKLESWVMKKLPAWLFLLVIVISLIFTVIFGWTVRQALHGDKRLGRAGTIILAIAEFPSLVKKTFSELGRGGSPLLVGNRFPEIDGFKKNGALQKGARGDDGYLLLSAYDVEREQSTVKLIRIRDEQILHEWVPDISSLEERQNTESDFFNADDMKAANYRMIHPLLLEDGSLVFKYRGPLYKINACSDVEWEIDGIFHHSIEQGPDKNFWVSSVIEPSSYDKVKFVGFRDDAIAQVSPDGRVLFKKSVSKILEENGYRGLLFGAGPYDNDPIHLNDVQPAFYSTEYWEKGDLLLSLRNRSAILLYRPSTNKIVWLGMGPWVNQHDVDFVGKSKISIFGNDVMRTPVGSTLVDVANNIYLVDFNDGRVYTPFSKILKKRDVRTLHQGEQEILDNGDVFLEETDYARILRISPKQTVWEFTVKVDDETLGMVHWSRYLTQATVMKILPALEGANCD